LYPRCGVSLSKRLGMAARGMATRGMATRGMAIAWLSSRY